MSTIGARLLIARKQTPWFCKLSSNLELCINLVLESLHSRLSHYVGSLHIICKLHSHPGVIRYTNISGMASSNLKVSDRHGNHLYFNRSFSNSIRTVSLMPEGFVECHEKSSFEHHVKRNDFTKFAQPPSERGFVESLNITDDIENELPLRFPVVSL